MQRYIISDLSLSWLIPDVVLEYIAVSEGERIYMNPGPFFKKEKFIIFFN